jgi:hypothetical protein
MFLNLPADQGNGIYIFIPSSKPGTSPGLYFMTTGKKSPQGAAFSLLLALLSSSAITSPPT